MAKPIGTDATVGSQSVLARRRNLSCRPVTSAELISTGVRPELLVSLALRRAASGGLAKLGDHYFGWGYPTPSWLIGVFEELVDAGFLALAEQDAAGWQRVRLTPAGHRRYEQQGATLRDLPDPEPAASQSVTPAPQADASRKPDGAGTPEEAALAVARSVLQCVIALAEQASRISDEELRSRLIALAQRAQPVSGSR